MKLDPVSSLLLDEARALEGAPGSAGDLPTGQAVLVIDDPALANHLAEAGHRVLAYCDDLLDERELGFAALDSLDEASLAGVELVLMRLPKSLGMLQDYAERVAAYAAPSVRLLAGGREKHLTRGMNDQLGRSFDTVRASLGRQKSRVLHAAGPRPGALSWPRTTEFSDLGLSVVSHAGTFAANRLDGGTGLLLSALRADRKHPADPDQAARQPEHPRAVDLGCGTGILASWLAREGFDVLAADVSRAACASAAATAEANAVTVEVRRCDGLDGEPAGSVALVACNPPFHKGTTKDSTPGFDLLRGAVPALAADAEVWTVFNSHLPYLPFLRSEIGPTRVVARDRDYTVTRSVRS